MTALYTVEQQRNLERYTDRIIAQSFLKGPKVGDAIELPDGTQTHIVCQNGTYWQTERGCYGYMDMAGKTHICGPRSPGVLATDLIATDKVCQGEIWFFDEDRPGHNRSVIFPASFTVWRLKPDADLSGVWELGRKKTGCLCPC